MRILLQRCPDGTGFNQTTKDCPETFYRDCDCPFSSTLSTTNTDLTDNPHGDIGGGENQNGELLLYQCVWYKT